MKVHSDFSIGPLLYYKIGGTVKYFLEVENKEDLLNAVSFIKKKHIEKIFVIGIGANLVFTDSYFDGAVIQMKESTKPDITFHPGDKVEAFAGTILDTVITFAFDHNLIGIEWAGGLPGTIGAAVRGNVGAFGSEIQDSFVSAEVIHLPSKKISTFSKEEMEFSYRESFVKKNREYIVVSVCLQLHRASHLALQVAKDIYYDRIIFRKEHHPLHLPNTGSVFKNIREKEQIEKVLSVFPDLQEQIEKKWYGKVAVASLIERLGMKGYRVGDAQISEKHALFIVNLGKAKAHDVLQVIDDIQQKFQETFGFQLETEVEIVE